MALPARRLTHDRDAIGAALTARAHSRGQTESFGDIAVPLRPPRAVSSEAPAAPPEDELEAGLVLEAAEERATALVQRSRPDLLRLLHPKLRWTTHDGAVLDQNSYIAANTGSGLVWRSQRLEDVEVVLAGDVAVLLALTTDVVERDAAPATYRLRLSQTWVREGGVWRCIASHASPAAAAPLHPEPRS